ncbi:TPA: TonB family protein [Klebsiella aerogenes]
MEKGLNGFVFVLFICTFLFGCGGHEKNYPPKLLKTSYPAYPYYAMANRIEGFVEVKFDIDSEGKISRFWIIKSEPQHLFDSSAISAMSKWRYEKGKPANGMKKRIEYKLQNNL